MTKELIRENVDEVLFYKLLTRAHLEAATQIVNAQIMLDDLFKDILSRPLA